MLPPEVTDEIELLLIELRTFDDVVPELTF
jgi:hypothetical protein